jgi:hypothetical protein
MLHSWIVLLLHNYTRSLLNFCLCVQIFCLNFFILFIAYLVFLSLIQIFYFISIRLFSVIDLINLTIFVWLDIRNHLGIISIILLHLPEHSVMILFLLPVSIDEIIFDFFLN